MRNRYTKSGRINVCLLWLSIGLHVAMSWCLCLRNIAIMHQIWGIRVSLKMMIVSLRVNLIITHLPLVLHICISEIDHHCSGYGLSPVRRQAIAWTNAGLLSIGLKGISFSEIWIGILSFLFKKFHLEMSHAEMAVILLRGSRVNFILRHLSIMYQ